MTAPRVSVVVPTRNRPSDAAPCVASVLANPEPDFELVVVDQSGDERTLRILEPFGKDSRFRYVPSETRGVSRSRNIGIDSTTAPIVAFTDDDCRVAPDWIARLTDVFSAEPDAAIVFGRVTVPEDVDGQQRYAAKFDPIQRAYQDMYPPPDVPWGIGANMACRRSLFESLGKFDPLLGPGAKFPAAEEYDLAIRALAAGMKVVNAAEMSVLHLGVREGDAASALVRGYGVAIGAALAKHVRLGTTDGTRLLASWVGVHGKTAVLNALLGRRPTNLRFVSGILVGIARAFSQPLDVTRCVYKEAP